MYKVLAQNTNEISIEEITISIVVSKYPQKLIKYLKEKQKIDITQIEKGIYYLKNTDIKTQIIVNNTDLDKKEAMYLKLLQTRQDDNDLLVKWINEYAKNIKDPLYSTIMNVLTEINPNSLMEVYKNMGIAQLSEENMEFLLEAIKKLEIDKKLKEEVREEVKEEVREEEREKGRKQLILKQYSKGLSIDYIADINDLDIEYVKDTVATKKNV